MGITRAQIARQLLAQGGLSLEDAKTMAPEGEFLAYINPKEAQMLKDAGGSGIMTPMGIPSFVDFGGAGSGYGSAQDTFDSAAGRGGSRTGSGGGQGPSRSDTGTDTDDIYGQSSETNRAIARANRSLGQKIVDSIKGISKFSPLGLVTRGLGSLFSKFGTFAQNMRGGLTQKQFEQARRDRINQNRISNILGRDAPFTAMTLENLRNLGFTGSLDGLIGSTNITRSGTPDDVYPDRVEGIVAEAPQTFRDAMAQLNLERGVPRDQVFLSAKDFIDPSKTISSEDLGTIQSRMATSAGVPESAIQLTKTFNTPEELMSLGAAKEGTLYGTNLTDEGKVLEDFRRSAINMRNAPASPTYQQGVQSQLNRMLGMPSLAGDVIENKDFIQDAINKGFLAEPSDFINQKPFEDIL